MKGWMNRENFIIRISSQEHYTDKLLYPNMHNDALIHAKAVIDKIFPVEERERTAGI